VGIRILAVDDARLMRMSLRHVLGRAGHEVDTARSVAEARERLSEHRYALVLTDLDLPDGSGVDVILEIRRRFPGVWVVALTASAHEDKLRAAIEAGAHAVIRKPFELARALDLAREVAGPADTTVRRTAEAAGEEVRVGSSAGETRRTP